MVFGADVNHGSPGASDVRSVAAVNFFSLYYACTLAFFTYTFSKRLLVTLIQIAVIMQLDYKHKNRMTKNL